MKFRMEQGFEASVIEWRGESSGLKEVGLHSKEQDFVVGPLVVADEEVAKLLEGWAVVAKASS